MKAEYIIRLDDACPTMDHAKWKAVQEVMAARGIRPIVAIVPDNADPALSPCPPDAGFWDGARRWAATGWHIALHGYRHQLRPSPGGLVPVNRYAEFTGLPWGEQRRRICEGIRILKAQGLRAEVWVAPAHGFDLATLQALREESEIGIISDGFARRPFRHLGFTWLPQQLWRPRAMSGGLRTICLHPNQMMAPAVQQLNRFIADHPGAFPTLQDAASRAAPYGLGDALFGLAYRGLLHTRKILAGRGNEHGT